MQRVPKAFRVSKTFIYTIIQCIFPFRIVRQCIIASYSIQLFQLRLSPEQSGKVEYERERLLGIANKWMNLLAIPCSSLSPRSYPTFPLCSGDNLNWNSCIHIIDFVHLTVIKIQWRQIRNHFQIQRHIYSLVIYKYLLLKMASIWCIKVPQYCNVDYIP
jgi:hypothetical protein